MILWKGQKQLNNRVNGLYDLLDEQTLIKQLLRLTRDCVCLKRPHRGNKGQHYSLNRKWTSHCTVECGCCICWRGFPHLEETIVLLLVSSCLLSCWPRAIHVYSLEMRITFEFLPDLSSISPPTPVLSQLLTAESYLACCFPRFLLFSVQTE